MKTYESPGHVMEFTAPSGGVVSGSFYLIGSLLVCAAADVAQALPFEGVTVGVFDITKVTTQSWAEGDKVYWDNSAKKFTKTSSGNTLVGVAVKAETLDLTLETTADSGGMTIAANVITIVAYDDASMEDAVVTVTVGGVEHELTEGVDWSAATSNNATATSLAAAIHALAGVTAAAASAVITVGEDTATSGRVRLDGAAR